MAQKFTEILSHQLDSLNDKSLEGNLPNFFAFAYELLKADKTKDGKYTQIFMNYVSDNLLRQIVLSNYFSGD